MRPSLALAVALLSGCTIETGAEPPNPTPWGVPISGGTVTVSRDGNRAVVADPDRDRVVIVDLAQKRVVDAIELRAGSEPGRVVEDGAGRIHVALRGSGELLTIDGDRRQLREVCGEPRGLAWQESGDLVHVACSTGELVSIPASGGLPVRTLRIERDLRDVVVSGDKLVVTTFRSANVLNVDATGAVITRTLLPPLPRPTAQTAVAEVAWRTIALPDGRIVVSHQRRNTGTVNPEPGGYSNPSCPEGRVESGLTVIGTNGVPVAIDPLMLASLPVDIATNGSELAVVSAGQGTVFRFQAARMHTGTGGCFTSFEQGMRFDDDLGAPTSVAFRPNGELLVYFPEADKLVSGGSQIWLGGKPGHDEGRALFHRETAAGIACASCHPEARDDGAVWRFDGIGPRRTQSLAGHLLSRAPYHWNGDMKSMSQLVDDVFAQRMGGGEVTDEQKRALGLWLERVPAPRGVVTDPAAVLRGAALFTSPMTACATCHDGELLTNKALVDVGTHALVKVPSLVGIGARAPFLHDGCAATLRERFGACGGDSHGNISQLTADQLSDLIAYLESL